MENAITKTKIIVVILLVLALIMPVALCASDRYISGDEVVSLSMSNNSGGGSYSPLVELLHILKTRFLATR